jgi:hypothetical protein
VFAHTVVTELLGYEWKMHNPIPYQVIFHIRTASNRNDLKNIRMLSCTLHRNNDNDDDDDNNYKKNINNNNNN